MKQIFIFFGSQNCFKIADSSLQLKFDEREDAELRFTCNRTQAQHCKLANSKLDKKKQDRFFFGEKMKIFSEKQSKSTTTRII